MLPCLLGMLMPSSGAPVALRRMVSYRLVLGTALVTAVISAAAAAALASFATGALPGPCTASSASRRAPRS